MRFIKHSDGKLTCFAIRKPDDMHQHVRQDAILKLVVPMVAKRFGRAIIMPNTVPPITTFEMVMKYIHEILVARDESGYRNFVPLMTMYLTDKLEPKEVEGGLQNKVVFGIKYYPPGLTTNSDEGVQNPASLWTPGTKPFECLRMLAKYAKVFLIHAADGVASDNWQSVGGHTYRGGDELDPYDQEEHFIRETLPRIVDAHPDLRISVEHMSTIHGVAFMRRNGGAFLGCSLTAHHFLLDRRDLFRRGYWPHRDWRPVIQSFEHTQELRAFAAEDHRFVWLGSDSAPHPRDKKESACCASGVLMAHAAIELYAEAFEKFGALDERFERFASINGSQFYGLFPNEEEITLVREDWEVKPLFVGQYVSAGSYTPIVPFRQGETVRWKLT